MPAASAAVAASDAWADCGTAHLEAAEVLEALATWRSAWTAKIHDFCTRGSLLRGSGFGS